MDDERAAGPATVLVNGQRRHVRTEPDTALLYVLRNHLGLKGTRFGCGLGLCGACLVLVDGQPAYSCDTPLWAVRGKEITTIEGLGPPERPHPVTRALIAGQAAQCGYCLSGVTIAAAALLGRDADPSEEEVRAALDANLCRCGAHNRIVRAVLAAAAELRAAREGPAQAAAPGEPA
jgi:nicotinate dehydrogenase subunit A